MSQDSRCLWKVSNLVFVSWLHGFYFGSVTRLGKFSPFGLHFEGPGEFVKLQNSPKESANIFGLLFEEDNFLIFLLYKKFQNRLWCRYSKVSNLVWCRYFWAWKRLWCRYFGTWKAWATFLGVNRWLGLQKFQYAWSHCTLA